MEIMCGGMLVLETLFLLLSAAAVAGAATENHPRSLSWAKPSCPEKCGNVKILYPFGIGEDCAINRWYNITCNSSKPYLSSFPELEVQEMSLRYQTITLSAPIRRSCAKQAADVLLWQQNFAGSPFILPSSQYKFVFLGCGSARFLQNEQVVGGCTSTCEDELSRTADDCYGIKCCETTIPSFLNEYSLSISNLAVETVFNSCATAFIAAQDWSPGNLSDPNYLLQNLSSSPLVFLWNLKTIDFPNAKKPKNSLCSTNGEYSVGSSTLNCICKSKTEGVNPYLSDGCQETISTPRSQSFGKPSCKVECGDRRIPYPFGIGTNCSFNEWYNISCSGDPPRPYLSPFPGLEVLNVSLEDQTVIVSSPIRRSCSYNQNTVDDQWEERGFVESPFFVSAKENKFMFLGCGNALLTKKNKILVGCTSACPTNEFRTTNDCVGAYCCQTSVPSSINEYTLKVRNSRTEKVFNSCTTAFLAGQYWSPGNLSDPYLLEKLSSVPVVLIWTLSITELPMNSYCYNSRLVANGVQALYCRCDYGTEGENPYLPNGCQVPEACIKCKGECTASYPSGHFVCRNKIPKAILIGVGSAVGVLLLVTCIIWLYRIIKKRKMSMLRQKYFKRNGGLLLQQQISSDTGAIEKTTIFTAKDLNKATDNFNENRILGQGGQGTVYKGMLSDGRIVAIKKSMLVDENQLEQFINEVVILSQINHRHVVKLLGCCLETEVPLLVYEYIPNGTLFNLIHNKEDDELSFPWNMRLRIATEIAGAVAYLHSASSVPIFHRDIKSSNILLDEKYKSKVSDFGTSKSITIDQTHLTTLVKGTFGYLDPEYFQSCQYTEKSDVYSFGVVLVELLTGQKPISSNLDEERSLATRFLLAMEQDHLFAMIDKQIMEEGSKIEIVAIAHLAQRCLNLNGRGRPAMHEVVMELVNVGVPSVSTTVQSNFGEEKFIETYFISGDDFTLSTMNDSTFSTSGTYPLLYNTM